MSELSCGTRFIGRNETLDQIRNPISTPKGSARPGTTASGAKQHHSRIKNRSILHRSAHSLSGFK